MGHAIAMLIGIAICVSTVILSHRMHDHQVNKPSQQHTAQVDSFVR